MNAEEKIKSIVNEVINNSPVNPDVMISVVRILRKILPEYIENEIIICAAIRCDDGYIARGHRHHNCFAAMRDMGKKEAQAHDSQGFVTSRNRYVGREEARLLQDAAGIKSKDPEGYRGDTLFSEDLY